MSNSKLTHVDETGAARQKTAPPPPSRLPHNIGRLGGGAGGGRLHFRAQESIRAALPHPDEPENCS